MTGKSSNSSIAGPGFFQRLKYLSGLLGMYRQRARDGNDFTWLHNALADYRTLTSKYRSGTFDDCRVLEIGFGARPLRLMAMNALGMDATGVDLDRPMTRGTPAEAIAIWKKNGAERAIKSLARYWLNDRRERRDLLAELGIADARPRLPLDRMIVSSAAADAFWQGLDGQFDVIVSEDVFEHIPRDDLETVVARMHGKLKPDGLALIRPMVFSGIAGGHHLEWYSHKADLGYSALDRAVGAPAPQPRPREHLSERHAAPRLPGDVLAPFRHRRGDREGTGSWQIADDAGNPRRAGRISGRGAVFQQRDVRPETGGRRMLKQVANRFAEMGARESFVYAASRFWTVRRIDRLLRSEKDHAAIRPDDNDFVIDDTGTSEYSLREDGLVTGLRLRPDILERLLTLEKSAEIFSLGTVSPTIHGREAVGKYNETAEFPVCRTKVQSPEFDALCDRIARNPAVLDIVRKRIGGIRDINIRSEWSLAVKADTAWRESQNQTVTFHYDAHGFNFVFVFFYLTDCGRDSGAHELVLGSQGPKPVRMLLSSVRQQDEALWKLYGRDRAHIVEGPPGFGFVEDTSCFHRARPPVDAPRLALQIRYA